MKVGTKTDIICSPFAKDRRKDVEFWWLHDELKTEAHDFYKTFGPSIPKPSVGVATAVLAVHRDYDVCVVGFDAVMNGMRGWKHDHKAERRCLEFLNVKVF